MTQPEISKEMHGGRVRYVPVVFKREWMGHRAGSELELVEPVAIELEQRGTVRFKAVASKAVKAPTVDKMVKEPERAKTRKRRNFSR